MLCTGESSLPRVCYTHTLCSVRGNRPSPVYAIRIRYALYGGIVPPPCMLYAYAMLCTGESSLPRVCYTHTLWPVRGNHPSPVCTIRIRYALYGGIVPPPYRA